MEWLQKNKWYIVGVIALVALFTNPGIEVHKAKVKKVVSESLSMAMESLQKEEQDGDSPFSGMVPALADMFSGPMIDSQLDKNLTVNNYILFSLTNLESDSADKVVGIGALGNVFLFFDAKDIHEKGLNGL